MLIRLLLILLIGSGFLNAQSSISELKRVSELFQNFNYQGVIATADSIITNSVSFDTTARLELLRMKGIAHYSLKRQDKAQQAFLEILHLKNNYTMDAFDTPPKIIEFYNIIKTSYNSRKETIKEREISDTDTVKITRQEIDFKTALLRSALFPGWGHFTYNENKKGKWLTLGALLTLPPAVYYIWDSNRKEERYLNETDRTEIEKRYDSYNTSYRLRNIFLISYIGIWLYTQFDVFNLNTEKQTFLSYKMLSTPERGSAVLISFSYRF